jgi:hypothetical protein
VVGEEDYKTGAERKDWFLFLGFLGCEHHPTTLPHLGLNSSFLWRLLNPVGSFASIYRPTSLCFSQKLQQELRSNPLLLGELRVSSAGFLS